MKEYPEEDELDRIERLWWTVMLVLLVGLGIAAVVLAWAYLAPMGGNP